MYLIDVYKDPYAGTERQLYNILKGLDKNRFQPALTVFRPSSYINENDFLCDVHTLFITRLLSFITLYKLIRFAIKLRRENYRIIHIFFNDPSIAAPLIMKLTGLKVLISRRDMGYWYTTSALAILRINRFFIDGVTVNCNAVGKVTHEKEKIPMEKIHTIYNGYDTSQIDNMTDGNSPLNRIKDDNHIVGIVANIRPIKRIDSLIRAFHKVIKKFPDTILVIVGDGDPADLMQLAKDLGIEQSVYFLGKQKNVTAIIRDFDVGVLCSESEGLSNVIIEYMQSGIPVITTDIGGNPELIRDGITGCLVPVNDTEALAGKLCDLLGGNIDKEALINNAWKHVTDICNLDRMILSYSEVYQSL